MRKIVLAAACCAASAAVIKPSVETLCDAQVDELDRLMAELRLGIRNQHHFDELETRANAIGSGLRNAFRKGRS